VRHCAGGDTAAAQDAYEHALDHLKLLIPPAAAAAAAVAAEQAQLDAAAAVALEDGDAGEPGSPAGLSPPE